MDTDGKADLSLSVLSVKSVVKRFPLRLLQNPFGCGWPRWVFCALSRLFLWPRSSLCNGLGSKIIRKLFSRQARLLCFYSRHFPKPQPKGIEQKETKATKMESRSGKSCRECAIFACSGTNGLILLPRRTTMGVDKFEVDL
jgi:hypothetical protein